MSGFVLNQTCVELRRGRNYSAAAIKCTGTRPVGIYREGACLWWKTNGSGIFPVVRNIVASGATTKSWGVLLRCTETTVKKTWIMVSELLRVDLRM